MFFIRTTLLLGLGVLVLPTDRESQARVFSNAKSAVNWTSTFCDRNPATCVHGQQAWGVFVKKAEFGAKMALDLISERGERQNAATPSASVPQPVISPLRPAPAAPVKRASSTLQATDLEPAWRGKIARNGS